MRHRHHLAPHADPDIAVPVGQRGVEQGEIGPDGLYQYERTGFGIERVVADRPVVTMRQQVGTDDAAYRHVGDALLGGLQAGVDRRAGTVDHLQGAGLARRGEARRRAELVHRHGGCFQHRHAAGADQQIALQADAGHADKVEAAHAARDQRPHHGHRTAAVIGSQRNLGAIADLRGEIFDIGELVGHGVGPGGKEDSQLYQKSRRLPITPISVNRPPSRSGCGARLRPDVP